MFDNINMYRGKHKHPRLYKYIGPTMWNFTEQALLVPDTQGLEEVLKCEESCIHPQKSPLQMDPNELFVESDDKKASDFNKVVDAYLLQVLDNALDKIPLSEKKLQDMTESELKALLHNTVSTTCPSKYNKQLTNKHNEKSNVHILPLSLEDNSTIVGTMGILDKPADDFALPSIISTEYLPFDTVSKAFDLKSARSHFELVVSKQNNSDQGKEVQKCLQSTEIDLEESYEDGHLENVSEESEDSDYVILSSLTSVTPENERRRFDKKDKSFWDTFNTISVELSNIYELKSEERYMEYVNSSK